MYINTLCCLFDRYISQVQETECVITHLPLTTKSIRFTSNIEEFTSKNCKMGNLFFAIEGIFHDIPKYIKIHQNTSKYIKIPSKYIKIHQNTSKYIKIHQNTIKIHQNTIKIHQNTSKYIKIHQNTIKIHQNTSKYIKIHQNTMSFWMSLDDIRRLRMG